MKNKDLNKITKIAEKLGWNVKVDGEWFLFSKFSPAGQDFKVEIQASGIDELVKKLSEYYESFDVSYETYLWLDSSGHGINGAPYDMKHLYEDMEACEQMIEDLSEAITYYIESYK